MRRNLLWHRAGSPVPARGVHRLHPGRARPTVSIRHCRQHLDEILGISPPSPDDCVRSISHPSRARVRITCGHDPAHGEMRRLCPERRAWPGPDAQPGPPRPTKRGRRSRSRYGDGDVGLVDEDDRADEGRGRRQPTPRSMPNITFSQRVKISRPTPKSSPKEPIVLISLPMNSVCPRLIE